MKLKLGEEIGLYHELNGLSQQNEEKNVVLMTGILKQKMSLKTKMYLQRLNNLIMEDIKLHEESRKELFQKLGHEENGQISIPKENMEEFLKESNNLLTAEKEINVKSIWGEDFTIDALDKIETEEDYPILFKVIESVNK